MNKIRYRRETGMGKEPVLGVLVLDTRFPRLVGDPGNEDTYNFPVVLKRVEGAFVNKIVSPNIEEDVAQLFVKAAVELEKRKVSAITTSCGFLIILQRRLSSAVKVPVYTSPLLLLPLVHNITRKPIGILTASSEALTKHHLEEAGAEGLDVRIKGLQTKPEFSRVILRNSNDMKEDLMEREIVSAAEELVDENPDIGSILCECTNLAPFREAIHEATGLPIFDYLTLLSIALSAAATYSMKPFYNVRVGERRLR
ncbi:MAG: hypothetical protein QXH32_06805 [Candidatus Caldarchaeum sp.]